MPVLSLVGLEFVDRLAEHGARPALLTGSGAVSYAELHERVQEVADRLGPTRRLVLVEAANTVDVVVAYLGALRGRHAVVLADATKPDLLDELGRRFRPDVRLGDRSWVEEPVDGRDLHPELALLLSTSGSTGSPKLVRLSYDNVSSNAAAIADYLDVRPDDRAITSLPLGYCYGLSVLHSHLQRGAGVVLTSRSVTDPGFWELVAQQQVTSFAGVPHTFALLDRAGFAWWASPTLRLVTQAGGRLPADDVRRLAARGRASGWDLCVMYGQTEATARMAYLPPSAVPRYAHCIGGPIPGGRLRVDGAGPDGVGELVYTGPNVMMGYAEWPADLAAPAGPPELRTGDLGREAAPGIFEVVGRRSRFAKILGHRIALDRVEDQLAPLTQDVVCTSDDRRLVIAAVSGDPGSLRRRAAAVTGLPAGLVTVHAYARLPRLANGKPDYRALAEGGADADTAAPGPDDRSAAVRAAFAEVLGYDSVEDSATFVSLGGDSLSFVEMSLRLDELVADVPAHWPELTVAELAAAPAPASASTSTSGLAPDAGSGATTAPPAPAASAGTSSATGRPPRSRHRRPLRGVRCDTSVALRAAAIVLVLLAHLQVWPVRGGAHLLLALAGFTFARFGLNTVRATDRVAGLGGSILRLALPAVVFIAGLVAFADGYGPANLVLLNHYLGPDVWTAAWNFWFLEALVEIMVGALLLFSVPAVRRFERRHPLLLPALVLAVGLGIRYDPFGWFETTLRFGRPHLIFWLFALGWLVQRSTTPAARLLASAVTLVTLDGYFPDEPLRDMVVQAGLLAVIWLPSLRLPALVTAVLHRVAAASLWVYLTHWLTWPWLVDTARLPWPLVVVTCLLVGIAAQLTADAATRRLLVLLRTRGSIPDRRPPAASPRHRVGGRPRG